MLDIVGSDKVKFESCDLAISKLEPYLGKVIISPNTNDMGSTEWVGLKLITEIPIIVVAYFLLLPDMCEAYRRLQSGKRHARFDPREFLQLSLQLPSPEYYDRIRLSIEKYRDQIIDGRRQEQVVRSAIDSLFKVQNNTMS